MHPCDEDRPRAFRQLAINSIAWWCMSVGLPFASWLWFAAPLDIVHLNNGSVGIIQRGCRLDILGVERWTIWASLLRSLQRIMSRCPRYREPPNIDPDLPQGKRRRCHRPQSQAAIPSVDRFWLPTSRCVIAHVTVHLIKSGSALRQPAFEVRVLSCHDHRGAALQYQNRRTSACGARLTIAGRRSITQQYQPGHGPDPLSQRKCAAHVAFPAAMRLRASSQKHGSVRPARRP